MKNNRLKSCGLDESQVDLKVQAGFTLIELLIVILIISILTVIAVGSYAGVQRQARIDFAADTLIAALREEQLLAKSGRIIASADADTPGKLQCFALKIKVGKEGGLWSAPTNYVGLDKALNSDKIDTCELVAEENLWQKRDIFDGDIIIKSISTGSRENSDQQLFYFKPPFGQLYWEKANLLEAQRDGVFEYLVGVADQTNFDRKVIYDVSTGEAKKMVNSPTSI